jgi:antitoxin component YwqK of YwqJK toxin-antitoxin module
MLVDGKPEGYWKTYYENGVLRSEGGRKRFQLDSLWKFYAPEGWLSSTIDYTDGRKSGAQRKYDASGALVSEERYVADVREGNSTYYHPNGQVHKVVPFVAGKEEGRGYEYAEDGRLVALLSYGGGMLRKREAINRIDDAGLKQGPWKEFHANGKVKWECTYVDDKRQGIYKEYDAAGSLKQMVKYDQDQVDTDSRAAMTLTIKNTYHANGRVASIGSYSKQGTREGLFREYDEQGQVRSAAIYTDDRLMREGPVDERGVPQGRWTEYYVTGEKRAEGEY